MEHQRLVFEGWAWKQGKVNKAFRHRFFKLHKDGHVAYFAGPDAIKPKGVFQLTHESTVLSPEDLLSPEDAEEPGSEHTPHTQDSSASGNAHDAADNETANPSDTATAVTATAAPHDGLGRSSSGKQRVHRTLSGGTVTWPKNSQADARIGIVTAKRVFYLQLDTVGRRTDFQTHFQTVIDGLQPVPTANLTVKGKDEEEAGGAHMRHDVKHQQHGDIEDQHEYIDETADVDHEETSDERNEFFQRPYHKVVIVGAGLAGIAAATHLREAHGIADVLVLEATPRPGGRVRAMQLPTLSKVYLDAGGCELYGTHDNDLVSMAREVACDVFELADPARKELDVGISRAGEVVGEDEIEDAMDVYTELMEQIRDDIEDIHTAHEDRGSALPKDRSVASRLARAIRTTDDCRELSARARQLLGYFRTREEAQHVAAFSALSRNWFLERIPLPGRPLLVRDLAHVVHDLAKRAHVKYNQPVTHIAEEDNTIEVNGKDVTAHMKVRNRHGRDVLCDFVLVTVPVRSEALSDEDVAPLLTEELKRMFPNGSEEDVTPLCCRMTRWSRHPHIHGAASFIKVNGSGEDMDAYAAPVESTTGANPRLFFAGEGTERSHHGTLHGAVISAKKQVDRMAASMLHRSINTTKAVAKKASLVTISVNGSSSQSEI
ncbi:hypothetical protein PTSG_06283 [Salpingoeca rosetta]|uniref:PH domain-containing protein n=1 Tax=Salpingoeca rosetta (strain ATCC 50818 / BSB-021) TaxID=946362 RepID=F2UCG7_SALR5|nr:uncharacterized protein PTSG_06283 [Salpingoeca rosetta]EGD74274.1 hypothetical protein PTSG_06283 [Salpingoeca rosetta]|eukprot:XP_004993174.1 hypothetical protein PTSG_06283 [Salpingoeca rosetta]